MKPPFVVAGVCGMCTMPRIVKHPPFRVVHPPFKRKPKPYEFLQSRATKNIVLAFLGGSVLLWGFHCNISSNDEDENDGTGGTYVHGGSGGAGAPAGKGGSGESSGVGRGGFGFTGGSGGSGGGS